MASAAHVGMGDLLREWGELQEAARHLKEGNELAGHGGNTEITLDGLAALSSVEQARENWDSSVAALHGGVPMATLLKRLLVTREGLGKVPEEAHTGDG